MSAPFNKRSALAALFITLAIAFQMSALAQTPQSAATPTVPRLVNFSGKATDGQNEPLSGVAGVTFAIYRDQHEGSPLWLETQNVQTDKSGSYTAQLGATKSEGLPLDLFSTSESRWLGIRINGGEEQPRILLLSVPYALKAADAETLGGLPASAFALATPLAANLALSQSVAAASPSAAPPPAAAITGSGTVNYLPLWTGTSTQGNSALFQTGTGSTAKVGINTTTPTSSLDINGGTTFRGPLNLVPMTVATAAAGKSSQFENISASSFSSSTGKAVQQNFRLQAEAASNNTASPGATLNFLFGSGSSAPAETGLKIANNGVIIFAPGQTFGGGGSGTVTSVGLSAPNSDFTVSGSPVTSAGMLGLNWNVTPTSLDNANAIVKRDASGNFSAGVLQVINVSATNNSGLALYGNSNGTSAGSNGVLGVTGSATASGVAGVNNNNGVGVYGSSNGLAVYGISSGSQAVWGESNGTTYTNGSGPDGVHGVAHSAAGSGVGGLNTAAGGIGVWGEAPGGYGFYTPDNVQQARAASGWVKAMLYVNARTPPYQIVRCFNSTLAGSAATSPPCGINFFESNPGVWIFDFPFEVDDRFYSGTLGDFDLDHPTMRVFPDAPNELIVDTFDGNDPKNATFTLMIF